MARPLDARTLEDAVRRRMQDEDGHFFTSAEILEAADWVLQDIQETVRLSGRDYNIRKLRTAFSAWTKEEDLVYSYQLPEYVHAPRILEGVASGILRPKIIEFVEYAARQEGRAHSGRLVWTFLEGSYPATLGIFGRADRFSSIDISYIQRFPDLHYGTSAAYPDASGIVFDTASTLVGPVIERDDVYNGMRVYMEDTQEIREIVDYALIATDWVASFDTSLTSDSGGRDYSLVVPLRQEHGEYLIARTVDQLYRRQGNYEWVAAQEGYLARLDERFRASISHRAQSIPKRFWSNR